MDEQQTTFGEGESFQQQGFFSGRHVGQPDIQVGEVIADEHWDLVRKRRRVLTNFDFGRAKFSCPIRCQVATDVAMKIEQKGLIQRAGSENAVLNVLQHSQDALGQQRRELRVGQNPARRFYEARGVRRLCRVFSHSKSTGSPSNAMLVATWRGTSAQDRKSTRLNSSHRCISYAVFCLKKISISRASELHPPDTRSLLKNGLGLLASESIFLILDVSDSTLFCLLTSS